MANSIVKQDIAVGTKLRHYQERVLQDLYRSWADGKKRTMVQMPTASGKTVLFAQLAREFIQKGERVLVVCHRIELIDQAKSKIQGVCLAEIGIIKSGVEPNLAAPIQIASLQSLPRNLDNLGDFGLLIFDEAHHFGAKSWDRVIAHFHDVYTAGFTATPIRLDGVGFAHIFDNLIGNISVDSLINEGYLSKYDLFASPVAMDVSKCGKFAGDYKVSDIERYNDAIVLAGHLIETYIRLAAGLPTVVFAVSVKHSIEIAARYNAVGIKAVHVDGDTPAVDRARILNEFKSGEIQIICNCGLFDEGVDLPLVGCVQIAKPTRSLTKYLQTIGRGLRISEGKERVIFIDHTTNYQLHGLPDEDRIWDLGKVTVDRKLIGKDKDGKVSELVDDVLVKNEDGSIGRIDNGKIIKADDISEDSREIIELVSIQLEEIYSRRLALPIDEIVADYKSGMTAKDIAKKWGVSQGTITRRLKEAGMEIINPSAKKELPIDEIIADYKLGMSAAAIAKKWGIDRDGITKRLKEAGIEIINPIAKKELPIDEIVADYKSGMSAAAIAKKWGVSAPTITSRLKEAGVEIINPGAKKELPIDEIVADYSSGMTVTAIAKKWGVSQGTIISRLKEAGVYQKTGGKPLALDMGMNAAAALAA
jgi:superfamily II DNA or RNA helicase/transposase